MSQCWVYVNIILPSEAIGTESVPFRSLCCSLVLWAPSSSQKSQRDDERGWREEKTGLSSSYPVNYEESPMVKINTCQRAVLSLLFFFISYHATLTCIVCHITNRTMVRIEFCWWQLILHHLSTDLGSIWCQFCFLTRGTHNWSQCSGQSTQTTQDPHHCALLIGWACRNNHIR